MDILTFLEKNVGKWFSQRTSYQLGQTEQWHQSDKTSVFQDWLPKDTEDVAKLCERCRVSPDLALGGLQTRWEKTYLKPAGNSLLVVLQESTSGEGTLLLSNSKTPAQKSSYTWGSDETLVITTELPEGRIDERLWFAAENLRLRTILMNYRDVGMISSFYSEIRLGVAPPQ
jgi:hypothetical protein